MNEVEERVWNVKMKLLWNKINMNLVFHISENGSETREQVDIQACTVYSFRKRS